MVLELAWRNIWRNKRRTVITVLALTLGVTAIVFLHSYREAAYGEMVRGLTRGLVGDLQVHGRGYQEAPDVENVVRRPEAVAATLSRTLPAASIERRVVGAGLGGSGESSTGVVVMGIDPRHPSARALLRVERGRLLGAAPAREAVLGRGLARELGVGVGGELILVGQAADGSLANDRFTVVGTANAGGSEVNATSVFLHLADAQSFFSLGSGVHQLIVRLPGHREDVSAEASLLRRSLDLGSLEVLAWGEMLPEFRTTMETKRRQQHVVDFIVFLIVALGVLNTMTMSTFERTREFGVMASLGTRRGRILRLVVSEALLQGLLGLLAGVAVAGLLLYGIGAIEYSQLGETDMMGVSLPSRVELRLHWVAVASAGLTAVLTMLAGGLIPALRASRLKPVEATRYV